MKSMMSLLMLVLLCSVPACAQDMNHNHSTPAAAEADSMVNQDWAKARLAKSPRHL